MSSPDPTSQDATPTTISPIVVESIDRVLASIRTYLNMDVAFLSEFLGNTRVFRNVDTAEPHPVVKPGLVLPMAAG